MRNFNFFKKNNQGKGIEDVFEEVGQELGVLDREKPLAPGEAEALGNRLKDKIQVRRK